MFSPPHVRVRPALRPILVALTSLLLLSTMFTGTASAHGSITSPASRNYGCWERWGHDHLNPNMAQQDPMCWQAWQANPNAMWNWNGLYRENLRGNHRGSIPDGQLCSGGRAEGGRYNALDAVGAWQTTRLPSSSNFSVTLTDQARHGADYFQIYVTRQGVNTATQPLRWSDLELIRTTGSYAPAETTVISNLSAPGRTGRHVVYTIWQASHLDQSYYLCSDVTFG